MVTTPTVPENEDVEKILTRIMSQNSGLMKQARTQGTQSAQAKGLGQSTAGIQAAQAAAYNAALPIASQQAQQGHQTGLQQAQFGQQDKTLSGQYSHETGMQTAGFTHAASQSALDRAQQSAILKQQGAQDWATMEANIAHENYQKDKDRSMQERVASMEISAADRERAAAAFQSAENSYAAMFSQIASNENLPADVRAAYVAHADNIRNSNINMMSSLYRASGTIPW